MCGGARGRSNEGTHGVTKKHFVQVCTSFREAESATLERRQNCAAVNQRHKGWIRAVTCQRGLASWRPIKLFRARQVKFLPPSLSVISPHLDLRNVACAVSCYLTSPCALRTLLSGILAACSACLSLMESRLKKRGSWWWYPYARAL